MKFDQWWESINKTALHDLSKYRVLAHMAWAAAKKDVKKCYCQRLMETGTDSDLVQNESTQKG